MQQSFSESYFQLKQLPKSFWIVMLASFINQMGNVGVIFLVLYLNTALNFSLMHASIGFVWFGVGMLFSGMFFGRFVNEYSLASVMIFSLLGSGVIFCLIILFHDLKKISGLCFVLGILLGVYRPASQTLVSQLSDPKTYKLTFSCYRLAINLGMSIGPAIGGFIAYYSFSAIYIINGFCNFIAAFVLWLGNSRLYRKCSNKKEAQNKVVFSNKFSMWIFLFGALPIIMIFVQHESTFAVFIQHDLHLNLRFYGLLFTLNTILLILFELPLNILTLKWPNYVNLILGGALIATGFSGLYYAKESWHIILLVIIWTVGEMIFYPAALSYISEISIESHRARYMSMYATCTNLGLLFGPWLGASIMQINGARYLWLTCGLAGFVSITMFLFLRITYKL